ncbi:MAG: hypothetical protein A2X64_07915 [Ignavibacteria bacterium GWF2_33_9]|nr:MAG: hypothetical protein A2X64_07915 [Ignavibacteria bacterium GWF2_33_9]
MNILKSIVYIILILSVSTLLADEIKSTKEGGRWNDSATWIGGVVPSAKDDVVIFGFVNSRSDECNKITIAESGCLNVESGITQVHSILINKGYVKVNENSTLKVKEIKNEAKDSFYNFGVIEVGE